MHHNDLRLIMFLNDIPERKKKKEGSAPVGFELTILDTGHKKLGGLSPIVPQRKIGQKVSPPPLGRGGHLGNG